MKDHQRFVRGDQLLALVTSGMVIAGILLIRKLA